MMLFLALCFANWLLYCAAIVDLPNLLKSQNLAGQSRGGVCPVGKSALQSGIIECPFSYGGFHVVCGFYGFWQIDSVCNSHGWKPAAVTDLNALFAVQTFSDCVGQNFAWIAAFNGLNADPCMPMYGSGGVLASPDALFCQRFLPVMCQEVPTVTETETDTTTLSTSFGTTTEFTTVTRVANNPPQCREGRCCEMRNDAFIEKKVEQGPPVTACNTCNQACPIEDTNLQIIRKPVFYERAAAECAKYGWSLADYTSGMSGTVLAGVQACLPGSFPNLWLRSYEGVDGARCIYVTVTPFNMFVTYGLTADTCSFSGDLPTAFPLCQCQPPAQTGIGPFEDTSTTTTTTVSITRITVLPVTTVTVTSTSCQKCPEESSSSTTTSCKPSSSSSSSCARDSSSSSSSQAERDEDNDEESDDSTFIKPPPEDISFF